MVTNPESSGSPPNRAPPPVPVATPSQTVTNLSRSESFEPPQDQDYELTVDDIEDFEDDEEEVGSLRSSRQQPTVADDLALRLPLFSTGTLNKYSILLLFNKDYLANSRIFLCNVVRN